MMLTDAAVELKHGIEARNRAFEAAYGAGDMAALAALYSPDARLLPPDAPVMAGRQSVAAVFGMARGAGFGRVTLETQEVVPLGDDAACEIGHGALVPEQGAPVTLKYAVVWRREAGEWRLLVDTWNARPA